MPAGPSLLAAKFGGHAGIPQASLPVSGGVRGARRIVNLVDKHAWRKSTGAAWDGVGAHQREHGSGCFPPLHDVVPVQHDKVE